MPEAPQVLYSESVFLWEAAPRDVVCVWGCANPVGASVRPSGADSIVRPGLSAPDEPTSRRRPFSGRPELDLADNLRPGGPGGGAGGTQRQAAGTDDARSRCVCT